ncbi:hypothetical protein [Leptothermofonsia sp. ETS-13]|uniref:hypothetical protein n=1 Tax=Leptothermofonsia sp. ETS-13 TaxID=3035696 RepID=UPI003BA06ABE
MLGMNHGRSLLKILFAVFLVTLLALSSVGTPGAVAAGKAKMPKTEKSKATGKVTGTLAETPPPPTIQDLRKALENYQPQVTILNPKPNEVLSDNTVSVRFQVKDLPIFKNEKLGLGPHLHVLLDNRTYQAVYDLSKPLVFDQLEPGTHTIRAFASRPWHESFKNEGAYTQVTFHVFTKTGENSPNPDLPLLTYSRPQGTYGAEPIMLDFYLTNAPLHLVAQESSKDDIVDWRIRCTINGESFILDQWQPIYLKGFKPGKNWVQLEFLDENGNPVNNVFNNTARVITYEPNGQDALSRLVRGDLSAAEARSIIDPNYVPEKPVITPLPSSSPSPKPAVEATPSPVPVVPLVRPTPSPTPSPATRAKPATKAKPSPKPTTSPVAPAKPKTTAPSPAPAPFSPEPSPRLDKGEPVEPSKTEKPLEKPLEKPIAPKLEAPKPEVSKPDVSKPQVPKSETPKPEISKPETPKLETPKPEVPKPSELEAKQSKQEPGLPGFLNRFRSTLKSVVPSPKPARPVPGSGLPSPSPTPAEEGKPIQPPSQATEAPKPSPVPAQSAPAPETTPLKERKPVQPSPRAIAPSKPQSPKSPESSPSPSESPVRSESPAKVLQPAPKLPTPTPKPIPQRLEQQPSSPSPIAPSPTPAPAKAIAPAKPPVAPQAPKPQPSASPTVAPNRSYTPKPEATQPESKVSEDTKPSPDSSKPIKNPTASDFYEHLRRARTSPTASPSPLPPATPSTGEPAPLAKPAVPGGTANP